MLQQERLHRIQTLLSRVQRLTTERIMNELNTSRETARRDIIELDAMGLARRVHGGIVSIEDVATEAPLNVRYAQQTKEKRAIARAALQHLKTGQTVFIDAGSTTSILAEELRTLSGLTIITNSLQVVLNLSMANESDPLQHEIILLGGRIQHHPQTQGDLVIAEIERYQADVALLSAVGVSAEQGASSFYSEEACIAAAMMKHSQQLILMADHSKLDVVSRVRYAKKQEISILITDQAAQARVDIDNYRKQLQKVILV